jgi:hypothetical protein
MAHKRIEQDILVLQSTTGRKPSMSVETGMISEDNNYSGVMFCLPSLDFTINREDVQALIDFLTWTLQERR